MLPFIQIEKQKIEMQQLLDQVVESEGLREQLQEYKGDAESRIEAAVRLKQESWMKEHHEELTSLREQETALFQEIDSLRNEASMWKTRFSQAQSELVEQIRAFGLFSPPLLFALSLTFVPRLQSSTK